MGHGTRPGILGHTIRTYWPDDSEYGFYLEFGADMNTILAKAQDKWGESIGLEELFITPKCFNTDCLGAGAFDPGDWTYFLHIARLTK